MVVQNRSSKMERDEDDTYSMYPHNLFHLSSISEDDNLVTFSINDQCYYVCNEQTAKINDSQVCENGKVCVFLDVQKIPLRGLVYGGVIARPLYMPPGFTQEEEKEAAIFIQIVKRCLHIRNQTQYVWLHHIAFISKEEASKRKC